jgi:hypothetical protein
VNEQVKRFLVVGVLWSYPGERVALDSDEAVHRPTRYVVHDTSTGRAYLVASRAAFLSCSYAQHVADEMNAGVDHLGTEMRPWTML